MGDTSDGYPGVRGIGEKTAIKLIQEHESIEGVLSNLDKLKPAQQTKIQEDLAMLELSQKLARIHTDVPLEMNLDNLKYHGFREDAFSVIEKYGLKTLTRDVE